MHDPGLARDRTELAWSRSALNMAVSGTLIARAAFEARLSALGIAAAFAAAVVSLLTWRHGEALYLERRRRGASARLQTHEFGLLTAATVVIAAIAIVVTVAA